MRVYRTFACDFETTVYKGIKKTEVWASASVELGTEDVNVFSSISDQFNYFKSLDCNLLLYYHNLKFDGSFWLSYFLNDLGFTQAYIQESEEAGHFLRDWEMENNTFKYVISDMGQWYTITVKVNDHIIEMRDSLKLLPFSLDRIGKSFKTKHQKLDIEYTGKRYAGWNITPEEKQYISNDVLVLKEGLEIMFEEGHKKLTIGSCCLEEYKKTLLWGTFDWERMFPDLYSVEIDESLYGSKTAGDYIRKSYRGGWCYVAKGKEDIVFKNGCTVDVNSLYPSMMSSESGNAYPLGYPKFFRGEIPEVCYQTEYPKYYFVRIKTRFKIKKNKLPFIQIKNTFRFRGNECLETSAMLIDGKYCDYYWNPDGTFNDGRITMTMTMTDYKLFLEHYDVSDFEILDGCYFGTQVGIFDEYIEHYKKIKQESKGAKRELAKLFLNNLYGKMAMSKNSSYKVAYIGEDGSLKFRTVYEYNKTAGYIPVGSAITSYARNFTIRAAQMNYYGKDKRGFIYADTDSIHCDLKPEEIKGVKLHDKNFCCWKIESEWDVGYFDRQKTYIEHVIKEDGELLYMPYYDIKCAGMPPRCKYLFNLSLKGEIPKEIPKRPLSKEELDFVKTKRTLKDFTVGLKIPGKLIPRQIEGGVVLYDTEYTFR